MKDNVVKEKTLKYAVKAVMLGKELVKEQKEYILSRQFVKSSTSIGAQVSEAEFAQSRADFINKMSIGLKEANESSYWIIVLHECEYLSKTEFTELQRDIKEIMRLLISIVNTSKKNNLKPPE